jgi:hypothetical protein
MPTGLAWRPSRTTVVSAWTVTSGSTPSVYCAGLESDTSSNMNVLAEYLPGGTRTVAVPSVKKMNGCAGNHAPSSMSVTMSRPPSGLPARSIAFTVRSYSSGSRYQPTGVFRVSPVPLTFAVRKPP